MRASKKAFGAGLLCLGGLGFGVGFYSSAKPQAPLEFLPAECDLERVFLTEGEKARAEATLKNRGAEAWTVTQFSKNCGCIVLDSPQPCPLRLEPGQEKKISVEISTWGKKGPQTFVIGTFARDDRGMEFNNAHLTVKVKVNSNLLASPERVYHRYHSGEAVREKIVLLDNWPGEGISVREVQSSNPSLFQIRTGKVAGTAVYLGVDVTKRYELDVVYRPDGDIGKFAETITVVPEAGGKELPPVTIPFDGKLADAVKILPASLSFIGSRPSQQMKKRVVVDAGAGEKDPDFIRVLKTPAGIRLASQVAVGDRFMLEFECILPERFGSKEDAIGLALGGKPASIPVTISLTP